MSKPYLLDTNVFVEAGNRYYRHSFCQGFWTWIEAGHQAGQLFSIDKVRRELVDFDKNDPVRQWAEKAPASFFLPDLSDSRVMAHYGNVIARNLGVRQYVVRAQEVFSDQKRADAFLIAAALQHGSSVVTHEKGSPDAKNRIPLPDAAKLMGISSLTVYELLNLRASGTFKFK